MQRSIRLRRFAKFWIAAGAGLAYAFEPIALLHERMMLTECLSLTAFAAFVLAGILYLRHPRVLVLFLLAVLSTVIVTLRISFLPILLASMAVLPLFCRWTGTAASARPWQVYGRRALHFGLSIGMTLAAHAGYKQWFHRVSHEPAAYNIGDGFFLFLPLEAHRPAMSGQMGTGADRFLVALPVTTH